MSTYEAVFRGDGTFVPLNYFLNGELHIILKLMNLEIEEHSSFFYY